MSRNFNGFGPGRGILDELDVAAPGGSPGYGGGGGGGGSGKGPPDGVPGGNRPDNPGIGKGDLYGDQYVLLRDLDPTDEPGVPGDGNGEPVLDANGQPILIGSDGSPIYFVMTEEGEYEIPADKLELVQEVELERANVARAPDKVMEKALDSALGKIAAADVIATDAAGRLVLDGVTIDSPLENLALYQHLMTAGGTAAWPDVVAAWPAELRALVGSDTLNPAWDPSSLLGAAFSKTTPITLDAVLYENTILGVNTATFGPDGLEVSYFDFVTDQDTESYSYDRAARYDGLELQWYANIDADPDLELVTGTVMDAVFGNQAWTDTYVVVGADDDTLVDVAADYGGVNDFAQAAEDARAVINFMHEYDAFLIG